MTTILCKGGEAEKQLQMEKAKSWSVKHEENLLDPGASYTTREWISNAHSSVETRTSHTSKQVKEHKIMPLPQESGLAGRFVTLVTKVVGQSRLV